MELLVEVKSTPAIGAIVHIGMALAPGDVRDFGHNGLQISLSTVCKVEGHRIELVAEVSWVSKQVDISDVCDP